MTPDNKKRAKKNSPRNTRRVTDYSNDPFFQKKADESKAFLEKHGFPAELLKKK